MLKRYPNFIILLSAGRGTRLLPYTLTLPKSLLEYKNKPILQYIYIAIKKTKINNVLFITNYLENKIKQYVNKEFNNLNIFYHHQKKINGTGTAVNDISSIVVKLMNEYIIICATDYVVDEKFFLKLINFHIEGEQDISVYMKKIDFRELPKSSYLILDNENNILKIIEKPDKNIVKSIQQKNIQPFAASLVYILPKSFFNYINVIKKSKRNEYELPDIINIMINAGYKAKGFQQDNVIKWENEYVQ